MTRVRKTLEFTQFDDVAEALSAESCHFALEASPPDCAKEVSRYVGGQSTQDQACDDPAEAESDSGDSLFITQKPAPEAQRSSRRQRSYSQRSQPASIRQLEEEDSSPSNGESNTVQKRSGTKRKKFRLPQYNFPFLSERRHRRARLSVRHNTALHYHAMGGFFKCVKELQQGRQRGDDLPSSLPTVDVEGRCIVPLSEDEEEGSESVDIKVVERKRFVFTPSKTKCSQPPKSPETKGSSVNEQKRKASKGQETSQERQRTMQHHIPAKGFISTRTQFSSHTESSDDGGPSQSVLAEKETRDKQVTSNRSILAHSETPTTERRLTQGNKKYIQGKEREEELCDDSDATYCERLEPQGSPRLQETVEDREASLDVTELPADVFITDGLSQMEQAEKEPASKSLLQSPQEPVSGTDNESVCDKTRLKKKRKAKGDDERRGQSQEDPEVLHAARFVEVEAGKTPSPTEENRAEPPVMQTRDEPENLLHDDVIARQEERHIPDSKHMKKRRKEKPAAGEVGQEEDGNLESEMRVEKESLTSNVVNGGEDKKQKKGKNGVVDDEKLKSSVVSEPIKDDGEILTKRKKRKKEKIVNMEKHGEVLNMTSGVALRQLEETGDCLENIESTQERSEPISEKKRKKHKKKRPSADQEDVEVGAEDLILSVDVSTEESTVKKKKIKEKKRESTSEGVDISCISDERNKVYDAAHSHKTGGGSGDRAPESVKKKKKKRESTSEGVDISGTFHENQKVDDADYSQKTKEGANDGVAESVTKKKKKKKKKRESTSEGVDVYCTPDRNEKVDGDHSQTIKEGSDHRDAESETKKKKKKKKSEMLSRAALEDAVAQSDDSVSVRKKTRTSSFLVADAEEKDAQTHEEQSSPCSNSAAAPVWGAGKPGVSSGAPETESAEVAGNVEETNNVARKKKRKRKVEESVQKYCELEFEEPRETCESFLPDANKMRVKRKKKSKGNESESVTAMERLESVGNAGYSQTDGDVVLRKKKRKKPKFETDHVIQESPTPATDSVESRGAAVTSCSSVSHKKKGKQSAAPPSGMESCGAEECCDVSDKMSKETLNQPQNAPPSAQTPGVINEGVRVKKKREKNRQRRDFMTRV
ncbi:calponin homology domain-containing protein DDB_G0272472-like [Paralichthys olivaceus]|uniref:calponin homology domain-containing protein DDB_G0272472-like n=1 Tax=Paralichthys olivaceus TaxID=8255 RepID=UPI003750CA04